MFSVKYSVFGESLMEKKKQFIVLAAYYLLIAAIVFFILKYALGTVLPFVLGFGVAALLSPFVRFLSGKYKMKYKPTAFFILLLTYATVGTLTIFVLVRTSVWLGGFLKNLPELYKNSVEPAIGHAYEWVSDIIERFDGTGTSELVGGLGGIFESFSQSLAGAVTDISMRALSRLSGVATAVPRVLIGLGVTVISSFFFIMDFEKILQAIKKRLPGKAVAFMSDLRGKFFVTATKYLRSYALIMLITFSLLFFGLSLTRTKNAAIAAGIIALLDVLPVIGTGLVLIPWALISIFGGRSGYGIALLAVWAITLTVRNIAEPKIVGKQVGLHPIVTLIAIFVGGKLFGFGGLILFPVGLSIAASVIREKNQPSEE